MCICVYSGFKDSCTISTATDGTYLYCCLPAMGNQLYFTEFSHCPDTSQLQGFQTALSLHCRVLLTLPSHHCWGQC